MPECFCPLARDTYFLLDRDHQNLPVQALFPRSSFLQNQTKSLPLSANTGFHFQPYKKESTIFPVQAIPDSSKESPLYLQFLLDQTNRFLSFLKTKLPHLVLSHDFQQTMQHLMSHPASDRSLRHDTVKTSVFLQKYVDALTPDTISLPLHILLFLSPNLLYIHQTAIRHRIQCKK